MNEEPRFCACGCGREIYECMGITKAGDVVKFINGEPIVPRELHGLCALKLRWTKSGQLVKRKLSLATP